MATPYASSNDYLNDTSSFDYARKKAADQAAADLQARKDALARRFASLGNLDSGARLKQEQLAENDSANALNNANEGINAQQNAELARRKEVLQGQQFQSDEAQKGRDFSAQQTALQRQYGTSEREAGQQFAAGQAALGRGFTTSEREASQGFASGERQAGQQFAAQEAQKQRDLQNAQFQKTYGLSVDQFKEARAQFAKTFNEDVRINNANMDFAQQALDKKGVLDNLTGGLSGAGKSIGGFFQNKIDQISSWF